MLAELRGKRIPPAPLPTAATPATPDTADKAAADPPMVFTEAFKYVEEMQTTNDNQTDS
jgi:hypothetical protein